MIPTANVSDALDMLGLAGQVLEVAAVVPGVCASGPAFTVRFEPTDDARSAPAASFIDHVPEGAVVVLDNGGRLDCTVWGGILSAVATSRRVAGTVAWGAVRDVDEAAALGYALFARGRFMRTGKGRARMVAVGEPVRLNGVPVRAGDQVVADGDGVVCVPAQDWARVRAQAIAVQEAEDRILEDVRAGLSLAEARVRHRYDALRPA